ncbi:hypothetical protein Ciccas_006209 [Cichlidogyrus casuarinus]|uniref:Uncharacterized protein n=1 Tax=Cichlidogyrus casuarinus TaxID=1844966 RepID=A0ABD2Q7L0_9PLAT
MASLIEWADSSKRLWERYVFHIENNSFDSSELRQFVTNAINDPVSSDLDIKLEEANANRIISLNCTKHQQDIILRRLISDYLKCQGSDWIKQHVQIIPRLKNEVKSLLSDCYPNLDSLQSEASREELFIILNTISNEFMRDNK